MSASAGEQRVQQRLQDIRQLWLSGVPVREIAAVVHGPATEVAMYLIMLVDEDLVAGLRKQLALISGSRS